MIKYLKILTTIFLLFSLWGQGGYLFAQNYPVQCTPIVTPPYTLSWVEYGSSPERLKVQLLLKDLTKTSVEVSLRIRLKGIGVVIENLPDFYTSSPITLLPGVPVLLSGAMLRENFKFEYLTAQGVDLETLYAGLSLPGGFYQWEITAFLSDQRQVSNVGMAMMTVFKNNPPQITFPQNNAVLMNTGFQSINFTWMPRHRYSTNAAAGTIYTFKIYEIPNEEDAETDPNIIVNSGVLPLFSTQSFGTNYTYKPSDPLLVLGRRYVIQVQAADINGLDEFENNGLSEVSTFSFGNPSEFPAPKLCKKPNYVLAEKLDEQSVQLTWMESNTEAPIDYIVNYKAENEGVWTERIVSEPSLMLVQLAPAKYQFKVSARCTYDNKSAFSNEETLQLSKPVEEKEIPEAEPQDTYVNTDEPVTPPTVYEPETEPEPAIDPLNTPLRIILDPSENPSLPDTLKLPKGYENLGSLPVLGDKPTAEQLKEALKSSKIDCASYLAGYSCGQHDAPSVPSGDIIQPKAGDEIAINSVGFEVVNLDAEGNGRGIVKVPMFNNAKFGVEFKGIKVAKGGCVVAGQADLSHVDLALLSEEQRKKLAETYATFNKVLAIADSLAPDVADAYNSLSDFIQKFKQDVSNYVGGAKDAVKMKKAFKAAEKYSKILMDSKDLSDSTKKELKEAYDAAISTKDFFCSGADCQEGKSGKGPWVDLELFDKPLCKENKAKVDKLLAVKAKAQKEIEGKKGDIYDFLKEFAVAYGNWVESSNNKNSLVKNLCGEYLMYEKTVPNIGGTGTVSYLAPPKGKKPSSELFPTETEYYQYVATRMIYSDKFGCKTFKIPETHYLDEKFFEIRNKILTTLNWEPSWIFKIVLLADGHTMSKLNTARDIEAKELLDKLLSNKVDLQSGAVSRIKEKNLVARTTDYAAVYFEGEFGGYILGKLGSLAIRSPFFRKIVGYLGSKIVPNLLTKEAFVTAINGGEDVFYVGLHGELSPRNKFFDVTVESHHGVNSFWMKAKYLNYNQTSAPSVFMLYARHRTTIPIFNTWNTQLATQQGVAASKVNYSLVTESEMLQLAELQFNAAQVPKAIREAYYTNWNTYKATLTVR